MGTGHTWRLTIAGVTVAAPAAITSYAAPAITAVIVSGAAPGANDVPTAGGATLVVMGTGFGPDPRLVVVLWNGAPVAGVALVVRHSMLSFPSPPGSGDHVTLRVVVGGQSTPSSSPLLRYTPPSIDSIALQLQPAGQPVVDINGGVVSSGDVAMDCGVVTNDGSPALAGDAVAVLSLTGRNFGAVAGVVTVAVSAAPCALMALSQTHIVCATSLCRGVISVTVNGVSSPADASVYAYVYNTLAQAPVVTDVQPLSGPLAGNTAVTLVGTAFKESAWVYFQAADRGGGALPGGRAECVWRGVPGMYCTDTMIR